MRTTISIQDPLLEMAKERAQLRRVTLSEIVEDALREHLAADKPESRTQFRLITVKGELVDPNLDLDKTSALLTGDDEAFYLEQR
jgi:hypothetical protein